MYKDCPHCRYRNPAIARFCASCGRPVTAPKPSCCASPRGAWIALPLIATFVIIAISNHSRSTRVVSSRYADGPTLRRQFRLSEVESAALFALLKPDDVKVLVTRPQDGEISVQGTPWEVDTVERLVGLFASSGGSSVGRMWNKVPRSQHGFVQHSYRLSRSKAKSLQGVVALTDIPALVQRDDGTLHVKAPPYVQDILEKVCYILRGQRQTQGTPGARDPASLTETSSNSL